MRLLGTVAMVGMALATSLADAQQPAPAAPATPLPIPEVGTMAPDFTFHAVTKAGIQTKAEKLSQYKGQTVVIWFFFKARTRG